ncbi:hypothetical protein [Cupriavidus plantarum]|uniref:Uncharacterized protein n=1 Tax=Cupriavidus plantarum TaxID=942865 RepID=A0A316F000_9BURK|nr:hypothetical protein [Cupriavidus plantarum]NYH98699.1 hypothetical protein [Cupriavidus plantarum]PWK37632.1 hypothetical protein C7419_1011514 [Cupriavidus plantarum]REF01623.1 hypothetical protein C7418_0407 [Cupriavidus plantarum]RLK45518.1 hypothetical protein C7417_1535 [Cupriavidus plantarum]CAG2128128.1 hypothetical protein LMG26296_01178 [Cupriavidus plantarum]
MHKQEPFNQYLPGSRTLFSHSARAARRRRIAIAAVLGTVVACALTWRDARAADEMVVRTMGPVSYVCGGVAEDERTRLAAQEKSFNMGILFTQGPSGEYLSDVDVRLTMDDGQEVATFKAGGPRCLIRAPEGSYNIEASYKGQPKTMKISTGTRNAQLRW